MDASQINKAVTTRAHVRISERNGWAAGVEGIALGFRNLYGTIKVGFVDANGDYTGEYTTVSYESVELVDEGAATEEIEMGTTSPAEQLRAKGAEMTAKLSDEALCLAWMATEGKPATQELAITRGWMLDELHTRLGDDLFDEWLVDVDDDGHGVNPLAYFERKATAKVGHVPCWICAQPATHTLTREGSITLHACDNCTRIDRQQAEARGWTITKKGAR